MVKKSANERCGKNKLTWYAAPSGRRSGCAFVPGALPQAILYWTFSPQKAFNIGCIFNSLKRLY
jgi:hypothetical protein